MKITIYGWSIRRSNGRVPKSARKGQHSETYPRLQQNRSSCRALFLTVEVAVHGSADNKLTPIPLMQLNAGFWSFKTFAAAVELGLFTGLADGRAVTLDEAVADLGIHPRAADMFLAACASLGLLEKDGDRYRNSPLSEEFLVEGRPHYFGGFVRFCDQREYPAWHRVIDAMRTNQPVTWDPATQDSVFAAEDPVMMDLFWDAMYSISSFTAAALADAYDFKAHVRLLDVGQGPAAAPAPTRSNYASATRTCRPRCSICPTSARWRERGSPPRGWTR
jgi:hypothetical protein